MYWYRWYPWEAMSLAGYTVVRGNWTQHTSSAIKTVLKSGPLTMKDLTLMDTGLYFCAIAH